MKTLVIAALCAAGLAWNGRAALTAPDSNGDIWTFLDVYHVGDGPDWNNNPQVYSGLGAAEFVFGAPAAGVIYAISIVPDFVTHTAVLDGWGSHSGLIADENYSYDSGNVGYNDPGEVGAAYSAYVRDGSLMFDKSDANYVWQRTVATAVVPEPSTLFAGALLALMFGMQAVHRRRHLKHIA